MATNHCAHNVPMKRLPSIKELVAQIGASEWFWRTQIWDNALPVSRSAKKSLLNNKNKQVFHDASNNT